MKTVLRSVRGFFGVAVLGLVGCAAPAEEECVDADCTVPPSDVCDGSELLVYEPTGTCLGDDCRYAVHAVACDGQCVPATVTEPARCATP